MLLFSKTCIYGIRAVLYVASLGKQEYVPIRSISEQLNISFHFLTKILQILTQQNLMISYRGPNGGVSLAKPAEQIKLIEIIEAIDGYNLFTECILGLPGCGTQSPCPIHAQWALTRQSMQQMLETTSLAELGRQINELGLRLADK